ncbi:scca2/scca1 fusion protein isoform 1 [Sphingobacteriaceae bacterium]|nr:scca2/scca1 fusion protein isoform 1 [Sphingobacteriaceae bacterium]
MLSIKLINFAIGLSTGILFTGNEKPEVKTVASNNNKFAFDLYHQLSQNNTKNIFVSPFSISTALAMANAGANGSTASEVARVMHFSGNDEVFHYYYGSYIQTLEENAKSGIQLKVANRLWMEKKLDLKAGFLDLNRRNYKASLEEVSFVRDPEGSRALINYWVEKKTEGKIKNLLPVGTVTSDTRLILTNAIYFKGSWWNKFDKANTKPEKFYRQEGKDIETPFMTQQAVLGFYENRTFKMVRLPYKGNKHSMVMVMPQNITDLAALEKVIDASSLDIVFQQAGYLQIKLSIPKFKMTLPLNLVQPLKNMGMKLAFSEQADFTKMCDTTKLHISDVVHKAFIEIDEEGTEAAAATAVVMCLESSSIVEKQKAKEFIANHPFLFYIVDDETKAIVFMGRVMDPTAN